MLHLAAADLGPTVRRRAEGVLLDQLTEVPVTTIAVPMPRDPRALAVAVFRKVTGVPPATYFTSRPSSPVGSGVGPTLSPRRPCG